MKKKNINFGAALLVSFIGATAISVIYHLTYKMMYRYLYPTMNDVATSIDSMVQSALLVIAFVGSVLIFSKVFSKAEPDYKVLFIVSVFIVIVEYSWRRSIWPNTYMFISRLEDSSFKDFCTEHIAQIRLVAYALFRTAIYFAGMILVSLKQSTKSFEKADTAFITNTQNYSTSPTYGEGYCSMAKHILLLLLTFGIYFLYWIYHITDYLNKAEEPPRNPTTKLLLCMFVPFYWIYWTYKSACCIDRLAASKDVPSDLSTLCLILAIFVPIIPPILMQDKINAIAGVENGTAIVHSPAHKTNMGAAEELKNYKELFDSGVISQEEFETKKKQLLNL